MTKLFLVGGTVRDHMLGVRHTKDLDFAVEADSFEQMVADLKAIYRVKVWQERPEFVTLRGKLDLSVVAHYEGTGPFSGLLPTEGEVAADFTLCRKEAMYHDNRHPSVVTPASLRVDLSRRDFTVNAIAVSQWGDWVDPFNGRQDCRDRILATVGTPRARFEEDPLRILRAVRFMVTHGLEPEDSLVETLLNYDVCKWIDTVSPQRIRDELEKACRVDWTRTMRLLFVRFPALGDTLARLLWMKPTLEER